MNTPTLYRVTNPPALRRMPCGALSLAAQRGLTLVELMVAVALAMILMLGALQIFLFSKNTYNNNQQLAEIQENGRFALYNLTRDIRNAGYIGQCDDENENHFKNHAAVDSSKTNKAWYFHDKGFLFGWGSTGKPAAFPSSLQEGLFIQYAYGSGELYRGDSTNNFESDLLSWADNINKLSPLSKDEVGVISNGSGCDIFVNDSSDKKFLKKKNIHGDPWTNDYNIDDEGQGFDQLRMLSVLYYVAADEDGVPTLYQDLRNYEASATGNSVKAIASGVENLKFEYGIRDSGVGDDQVVGSYIKHDAVLNWREVVSVKISFSINSTNAGSKEFTSMVRLRNSGLMGF